MRALGFALLLLSAATIAAPDTATCKTKISAVVGNNPALTKVTITIKKGKEVIATRKRHSFEIKLRCKVKYTAVAVSEGKTATRNFHPGGRVVLPLK